MHVRTKAQNLECEVKVCYGAVFQNKNAFLQRKYFYFITKETYCDNQEYENIVDHNNFFNLLPNCFLQRMDIESKFVIRPSINMNVLLHSPTLKAVWSKYAGSTGNSVVFVTDSSI